MAISEYYTWPEEVLDSWIYNPKAGKSSPYRCGVATIRARGAGIPVNEHPEIRISG